MNRFAWSLSLWITGTVLVHSANAERPVVTFDLPSTVAANAATENPADPTRVSIQLKLSSMITSAQPPRITQWIVRCQPRDASMRVLDYSPRTETASSVASPIQVKRTEEKSKAFGMSLDGAYGHLVQGHGGVDQGKKDIETKEFSRVARQQAIIASGTIDRARGVYFKLRWSEQQVLEGEKCFDVTFQVPAMWRGSLVDVSVQVQGEKRSLAPWGDEVETLCREQFVVAAYRDGDKEAELQAHRLAEAEMVLQQSIQEHQQNATGWPAQMWKHMPLGWDPGEKSARQSWLPRLLQGEADPRLDRQIRELPMALRVAVLDYAENREAFSELNEPNRYVVAKPAQ